MELKKAIELRHSARKFISKKPDWRDVVEAVDAANRAPSAGNLQSLRFILVSEPEKIAKLAEASGQDFVAQAYCVVVVCSDDKQTVVSYDERGQIYCRQQAGAAIENFLLRITDLGLASCWVGAFVDDIVRRTLEVPDGIHVEALLPVGYEAIKGKSRKKLDLDNFLFFDTWKNKFMKPIYKGEVQSF